MILIKEKMQDEFIISKENYQSLFLSIPILIQK